MELFMNKKKRGHIISQNISPVFYKYGVACEFVLSIDPFFFPF